MSVHIEVRSRGSMETFKGAKPYIVVSIRCPNDSLPKFSFDSNRKDVIYLEANDLDNVEFAKKHDYKIMEEEDAERILDFVEKHIKEINHIVVHCDAGVSRSAGIGAALLKVYNGSDEEIMCSKRFLPNMHNYRLILNKAFEKGIYKP